jgi:Hemerythrin HHE cation binding domain
MMTETPLPTLFGRLTMLLSEHEHLNAVQARLGAMCEALESGRTELPASLQPAKLIANLQGGLSRHFAAEETAAHFGAVTRERPALLPRIVELKADHVSMLKAIAGLALIAPDAARWGELVAPTRLLLTTLGEHEVLEAALVQQFMTPAGKA